MAKNNICITIASRRDQKAILSIRNDPHVRRMSQHAKLISPNQHLNWFNKIINDDNVCLYVAKQLSVKSKKIIGYVRYDKKNYGYKISIAVAADYRNQGIGSRLLTQTISKISSLNLPVYAVVKKQNYRSFNFFQKHNFNLEKTDANYYYLKFSP